MKDVAIKIKEKENSVFYIVFSFFIGFIFSGGLSFNNIYPFIPAFIAASPISGAISGLLGSALGLMIFSDFEFFITSVFSSVFIIVFKILIKLIFKKEKVYISCILAASVSVLKAVFSVIFDSAFLPEVLLNIAEGFMAAGFCLFFSIALPICIKIQKGSFHIFTKKENIALLASLSAILISLNSFFVLDISVGIVFAILLNLSFAFSAKNPSLSLAIVSTTSLTINNTALLPFCTAIPISILLTYQVKNLGKYGFSSVFMLVSTLISLLFGLKVEDFTAIIAAIIGTVLFVFCPASLINNILPYFSEAELSSSSKIVSLRLKSASSSLSVLADALEALYPKKRHEKEISNNDIFGNAVNTVCKKCPSMGVCWGSKYNDTTDILNKMVNSLKFSGNLEVPLHFKSICNKNNLISEEIKSSFLLSKENRKNEGKLDLVKNAVSESYRSVSFLLDELSDEIETICYPDSEGEILLKNALLEENAKALSLSAFILNGGKTIYEFVLNSPLNDASLERIRNELSDVRGDKYSLPILISAGENYLYRFSEIENYSLEYEEVYLNIKCEDVSGDKLCSFSTKYGFYYTILSDGMGSGKKAAREAEITAISLKELISGGLTLKSAVKIVNSMLVSQTDNEISSAIDIVKIDKYTAETEIFKAGGTPTFIRQKGKVSLIESPSMPIGILADEEIFETKLNLYDGDIIITLSDGVLENGVDWIKGILSQKRLKTPKEIKESIFDYIEKNGITFSDDAALGIILIRKN